MASYILQEDGYVILLEDSSGGAPGGGGGGEAGGGAGGKGQVILTYTYAITNPAFLMNLASNWKNN